MTLTVEAYYYNGEATRCYIAKGYPQTLAGFEVTRNNLWGSTAAQSLGIVILTRLRHQCPLLVEGQELVLLVADCDRLLENLPGFAQATHYGLEYVRFRLHNIRQAAREALNLLEQGQRAGVEIG